MTKGFASLPPARRREIASLGGRAVEARKRSFSRDPELAAAAGRKGGLALADEKRSFSRDHEFARTCGRKGGATPRRKREEEL
jgi:general stress protein YciG